MNFDASLRTFDPFSLTRLLTKSFGLGNGERVCVLIDLTNPEDIKDYAFLNALEDEFVVALPDRLLAALTGLEGSLACYQISRLEHSL